MSDALNTQNSKCFAMLSSLMDSNILSPHDAFLFGFELGKNTIKNLNHIIDLMKKILKLKVGYSTTQKELDFIYHLALEQNWTLVSLLNLI